MKYLEDVYYKNNREDLIALIPVGMKFKSALEIGCGEGNTLMSLKERGIAEKIIGIDIKKIAGSNQEKLDRFVVADLNSQPLKEKKNSFDLIILGDILEHLIDPWVTLQTIKNLLTDDGIIISSIPNIRFYKALKSILIEGSFKYSDEGIFDRTHLRFFAKKDVINLFTTTGFKFDQITSVFDQEAGLSSKGFWFNKLTFGFFHDLFVYQFLIRASKK